MNKFVDVENDRKMLISDLGLSARAKNILINYWLKMETFGELLDIDYYDLKNVRTLGLVIMKEIKTMVHNKGYFLSNEEVLISDKVKLLKDNQFELLESIGISKSLCSFLYKNNIFTLEDLINYGIDVFNLSGLGKKKKEELNKFLLDSKIILNKSWSTKVLNDCKCYYEKMREINKCIPFPWENLSIESIGNLYIKLRRDLVNIGIKTLSDLINTDYNELKDRLFGISDIELIELVNFLHRYGLEIFGYDQTNYNTRGIVSNKDNDELRKIDSDSIEIMEKENVDIESRIEKKKTLIKSYRSVMNKRELLLKEEAELDLEISSILKEEVELDLEISSILKEMKEISKNGRKKVR